MTAWISLKFRSPLVISFPSLRKRREIKEGAARLIEIFELQKPEHGSYNQIFWGFDRPRHIESYTILHDHIRKSGYSSKYIETLSSTGATYYYHGDIPEELDRMKGYIYKPETTND